jgi:hypothetical protein
VAMLFGQLGQAHSLREICQPPLPLAGKRVAGPCRDSRRQRCNIPQRHPFFQLPYRR